MVTTVCARPRPAAPLETAFDRGLHGHAIERAPEELDAIALAHERPPPEPGVRPAMPDRLLRFVQPPRGLPLAEPQARALVPSQEGPERRVLVAGDAAGGTRSVAPQHGDAADEHGMLRQPEDRAGQEVEGRRPHEVLPVARAHAAGPDALLARSHGAQVDEPQALVVHALRDPAQHSAAVAVDAVPHHLSHEPADLAEARDPVELRHAHGHLVAAHLGNQRARAGIHEVGLSRGRPDARVRSPCGPSGVRSNAGGDRGPGRACRRSRTPRATRSPARRRRPR